MGLRPGNASLEEVEIQDLGWYGEWSGRSYRDVLPKVLAKTKGAADLLFVWEGGDSFTGLRVKDGVVVEKRVVIRLEE